MSGALGCAPAAVSDGPRPPATPGPPRRFARRGSLRPSPAPRSQKQGKRAGKSPNWRSGSGARVALRLPQPRHATQRPVVPSWALGGARSPPRPPRSRTLRRAWAAGARGRTAGSGPHRGRGGRRWGGAPRGPHLPTRVVESSNYRSLDRGVPGAEDLRGRRWSGHWVILLTAKPPGHSPTPGHLPGFGTGGDCRPPTSLSPPLPSFMASVPEAGAEMRCAPSGRPAAPGSFGLNF